MKTDSQRRMRRQRQRPDTGRRWYVSWWDSEMYYYCRRIGNDKTAEKILEAQLNYAMTDEYYMAERYDDHDPYFSALVPELQRKRTYYKHAVRLVY